MLETQKNVLAIIPARAGSKGLVDKNIRELNGRPLIWYTIEAARQSKYVTRTIVTTDIKPVRTMCMDLPDVEVVDRPEELARDDSLSSDVVKHVLQTEHIVEANFDAFVLLQPTSPLRTHEHIDEAIERFFGGKNASSCVSVCEAEHSPSKMLVEENGVLLPYSDADSLEMPRQKLPKVFRQNGAIYILKTDDFLSAKANFCAPPCIAYEMDRHDSVDIDDITDLKIAEFLMCLRDDGGE